MHRLQAVRRRLREPRSAGSRSASTGWPRTAARPPRAIRRSTSTRAATASSPTSRSPAPNDTVGWTVWYEKDHERPRPARQRAGLRGADRRGPDGRRRLQLARRRQRTPPGQNNSLDTTGANQFGNCAVSTAAEDACSLNKVADATTPRTRASRRARSPRAPRPCRGSPSRRTSAAPPRDLRLAPGRRRPLRAVQRRQPALARRTPDATSRTSRSSATRRTCRGRRTAAARPAGSSATSTPPARSSTTRPAASALNAVKGGRASLIDARVPLSSSCTADPFTKDGATCTPADVNAPFYTFTTAGSPAAAVRAGRDRRPELRDLRACKVQVPSHHHARIIADLRQRQLRGHPRAARARASPPAGRARAARRARQGPAAAALEPERQRQAAARGPLPRHAARAGRPQATSSASAPRRRSASGASRILRSRRAVDRPAAPRRAYARRRK